MPIAMLIGISINITTEFQMKFFSIALAGFFLAMVSHAGQLTSPIEVVEVGGQRLVLIPASTAQSIANVLNSELSDALKITEVKSQIAAMAKLEIGQETFCSVAGETYQSPKKDAAKMAKQCEDRLSDSDMLDELPDGVQTAESVRDLFSRMAAIIIVFSIF
jgi:hypothetical protein